MEACTVASPTLSMHALGFQARYVKPVSNDSPATISESCKSSHVHDGRLYLRVTRVTPVTIQLFSVARGHIAGVCTAMPYH
jgi:hypothetical protein